MKAGSINPNLFQAQEYKFGSICNPSAEIRGNALAHLLDSVEIGRELGSKDVSLWIADGSNYPGTQSIRKRIEWMEEVLASTHAALGENQRMLVEYKPFEPAFYHTDIADWGMALELSRRAGPKAKVLVDTGHHLQGTNIEQIVDLAAALRCAGRLPLQRSQVRRRRSHHRVDRSVPGVPHLQRDHDQPLRPRCRTSPT